MGGINSRFRFRQSRQTVESRRSIDVRVWARSGLLRPGCSAGWAWTIDGEQVASIGIKSLSASVVLDYFVCHGGEDWERQTYAVQLSSTACHFGNTRAWFLCPAKGCGRRVAKLYLSGRVFACRHCHRLAYPSSREGIGERTARKADKLRRRLNWEPGILNGIGSKPKWMRWHTYEELAIAAETLTCQSILEMGRRLGIRADGGG